MKIIKLLFALFLFSSTVSAQEITLVQFATGFTAPVHIVNAGDERLFIVERFGKIKIIDEAGATLATPFLDISSQVNTNPNERGLLGLVFHPDYTNNGYFYVNYTRNDGDTRISRFSVDATDSNIADQSSETIIMEIAQPFWNHDGGNLVFGPDGYLYIGTGDGGDGGDPGNRAQNPQNLLGKMLRIDVDNGTPYGIPADNPFVNDVNTLDEIWAIGLRNPWRYSFDRETGDLWIGDVGQGQWEEIDFEPANSGGGFNYGWRCYEGNANYNTSGCGSASDYMAPILDYNHSGFTHCSVTGGFVYRGCDNPDLKGHYIYADYCSGRFWSIVSDGAGGWNDQQVGSFPGYDISTFGEDVNGELYTARLTNGRIYKINSTNTVSIDIQPGVASNTLEGPSGYDTYQWFYEEQAIGGATADTLDITSTGTGNYMLVVTTANGCTYTSEVFFGVLGLEDLASFEAFSVNPNPFTDELTLSMEVNSSTEVSIQVVDITGKIIFSKEATLVGTTKETLQLSDLSTGVYFIHLKTTEGTITRKVVKEQ
ncbi:MAG: glucose/arabinose dehydrogenase [Saprospiraceae bacterium]|jgi:glucose/arabinose dehydrogenase